MLLGKHQTPEQKGSCTLMLLGIIFVVAMILRVVQWIFA
jgi:hypothetical protein